MLVQRQTPKRLRNLLIAGAAIITPVLGYVVYLNFFSGAPTPNLNSQVAQKTVPQDFGQNFFRDARFNSLVPQQGTAIIAQSEVTIPGETLPAPSAVQVFDMQSGGTLLFTWKRPEGAATATSIRLNRLSGQDNTNIVTLPATATSYQYRGAVDGQVTSYELYYTTQLGVQDSPAVQARAGAASGPLTIAAAAESGVKLTWTNPVGEHEAVEVYRSTTVGELGARIARLGPSDTSYDDISGRPDIYFYLIRWVASNVAGQVWQGAVASTDREAPASPQAITASYVASGAERPLVRVTWSPSPSPDVVSYDIYRSANAMSLGSKIGSKAVRDVASIEEIASNPTVATDCARQFCFEDTSFATDTRFVRGVPYYYTVIAIDAAQNRSSLQELGVAGRANPFIPL